MQNMKTEKKTQNNDKPKLGKNNQTHMQTLESDETKIRLNH